MTDSDFEMVHAEVMGVAAMNPPRPLATQRKVTGEDGKVRYETTVFSSPSGSGR